MTIKIYESKDKISFKKKTLGDDGDLIGVYYNDAVPRKDDNITLVGIKYIVCFVHWEYSITKDGDKISWVEVAVKKTE